MRLIINGELQHIETDTLNDLLALSGFEGPWLATAVNGTLIHRDERQRCKLSDGDRIEILSPMQGG